MTHKELAKKRINHYLNRIIEMQKRMDRHREINIHYMQYEKAQQYYKNKITQEVDELLKEN